MRNNLLIAFTMFLSFGTIGATAQTYRTSSTEALQNTGGEWIQKKLPPSLITFSDYSGQVEIKAALSSLFQSNPDSGSVVQTPGDTLANFTMSLDKEQIKQQQISAGKTFTTTGNLVINNISRKANAQYQLIPRNNPSDGFIISVVIRFNPGDFGMKTNGESDNEALIVRVTNGYLNPFQNNFK